MKIKKTILFTLLCCLLCIYACAGQSNVERSTDISHTDTRTIIDAAGREVLIPSEVNSVVPLANALRMMCYLDAVDLVSGIELRETEDAILKAYNYVNHEVLSILPVVGTGGNNGYSTYYEELVTLAPDVIICGYTKEDAENLQSKTGIPVVIIHTGTLFEEDYNESLRIIGQVCNKEDRAEEVIQYINDAMLDLENRSKDFPESEKPSVYVGALSFSGRHGIEGTYTNFPPFTIIEASDIFGDSYDHVKGITIDRELLLTEDPDILFLDPVSLSLVNADFVDQPEYYQALSAYRNGAIYTMIGYNYYYTNVEIAIADAYYAGTILYPQTFEDIDMNEKAKEIFSFFLDSDTYYQDLQDAGFGFGPLSIGE